MPAPDRSRRRRQTAWRLPRRLQAELDRPCAFLSRLRRTARPTVASGGVPPGSTGWLVAEEWAEFAARGRNGAPVLIESEPRLHFLYLTCFLYVNRHHFARKRCEA